MGHYGISRVGQHGNDIRDDEPPFIVVNGAADFLSLEKGDAVFGVLAGVTHGFGSMTAALSVSIPTAAGQCLVLGAHAPRVRGSAPSQNPLTDVSDEGVADGTRGACAPQKFRPNPAPRSVLKALLFPSIFPEIFLALRPSWAIGSKHSPFWFATCSVQATRSLSLTGKRGRPPAANHRPLSWKRGHAKNIFTFLLYFH